MSEETTPDYQEPLRGELVEYEGALRGYVTADPLSPKAGLVMTWDRHEQGGIDRLSKCLRPADRALAECVGSVLIVEHILMHVVEFVHESTAEIVRAVRVVLIDVEGNTYGCVARGVLDSVPVLTFAYGELPWHGGQPVRVVEARTRKKRKTLLLEAVEQPRQEK